MRVRVGVRVRVRVWIGVWVGVAGWGSKGKGWGEG